MSHGTGGGSTPPFSSGVPPQVPPQGPQGPGGAAGPPPYPAGPPVPPYPGERYGPPVPSGPPPPHRQLSWLVPVVAAVVVVAALLSLLILRSCGSDRDGEPEADGTGAPGGGPITLSEPLLVLPVLAAGPGTCANPDPPRIMGDAEQTQCLTLDTEGGMTVTRLADSSMDLVNGEWVVMLSFLAEDAARFGDLTGQAATHEPPRNQIALVLGEDRLLSAPAVAERLDDGEVQISGGFTRAQAEELAEALGVTI